MNTELPEKNFIHFLKSNSKIFIYSVIVLILFIAISSWFVHSSKKEKMRISENFVRAQVLIKNNNKNEAIEILKEIIKKKNTVYSSLSLFLLIDKNLIEDRNIVLNYFDHLIDNNSYTEDDAHLLRLKKALYISDTKKEQEILELLNPVINSNSAWKAQALKFLGDFYYSKGQFKKAKQYYSLLLQDDNQDISKEEINRKINSIKNE
tara:strand:- start:3533 stop:4153 length:621 start_codon:yes stop_codon:yes gene_type:complete